MDWGHMATGAALYAVASYAARTFPTPSNQYARWLAGIAQYALSNPDLGAAHFAPQEPAK